MFRPLKLRILLADITGLYVLRKLVTLSHETWASAPRVIHGLVDALYSQDARYDEPVSATAPTTRERALT